MIFEGLVAFIIFFFLRKSAVKLLTLMNDVEWGVMSILDEKVQYSAKKTSKHSIIDELRCSLNVHFNESPLNYFFLRVCKYLL